MTGKALLTAPLMVLLISAATTRADTTVRITTFNIADFGGTAEVVRSLVSLANAIRETNPDIVALQEVEPGSRGRSQVAALAELLNKAAFFYQTEPYSWVVSSFATGDERYAFLWRSPIEFEGELSLLPHDVDPDGDGLPTFIRTPVIASFEIGTKRLEVANCHLYTRLQGVSAEGRGAELAVLASYLRQHADDNLVVLGDFNRFLNGKSLWPWLATPNHEQHYKFVLLRSFPPSFDLLVDDAPEDRYSTTASRSRRLYDQIVITRALYDEFGPTAVFGQNVGIHDFDNLSAFEWFGDDWSTVRAILSDHRPVWVELRFAD